MLQITKQGNSIVVEGLNHYFYPYNGTLEVPCNSVITVVDEGNIVLFRSASNYDVLFSAKVDEITINGQSVTKDNVGEVFGALSNTSSGGGGLTPEQEEKLNNAVQISVYNADKATQTTIDEAQNTEINKVKGDIAGKQDIIQDLNAIREGANLGKTALQEETDPIWTAEKGNYYTKTESDGKYATQVVVNEEIAARISDIRDVKATLETKADKSEIPNLNGYATEQWVGDKGYITEETDPTVPSHVKAITEEDIAKWNKGGYDVYQWSFYPYSYATKEVSFTFTKNESIIDSSQGYRVQYKRYSKTGEIDGTYQTASIESFLFNIPLTDDTIFIVARLEEIEGNYTRLEFSFDVVSNIKGGGITEETDPIWNAEKGNYYTKTEVNTSLEAKANKTEIPSLNGYATEQWVGQQGYLTEHQSLKTINGETIVGNGDITISGGEETDPIWNAEKGNYYTKSQVDTSLESKANKSEIPSLDNYYTKSEVNTSLEAKADKTEIPTVPTNVSAFTNDAGYLTEHQQLKTINGETIVGSGDIVISGGGEETDPIWTAEKVNYYTKSEIDGIVGNVNNALSEIING